MRVVALAAAVVLAACGADDAASTATEPPSGPPAIVGEITSVAQFVPITGDCVDPSTADPDSAVSSDDPPFCTAADNGALGTILIEDDGTGDKGSLSVDRDTRVLRRVGDTHEPIDFADLTEGDQASAWVSGPVAESFPWQARADAVVVTTSRP